MKIIAKKEIQDSGTVNIRRGASIGLLNQIYDNEKEDILVEDFLYDSFNEVFILEEKLRVLETQMSNEENEQELERKIKEYGKLQDKYILSGGYDIQEKYSKICSKFHITEEIKNQKYNNLSGGEKTRVNQIFYY